MLTQRPPSLSTEKTSSTSRKNPFLERFQGKINQIDQYGGRGSTSVHSETPSIRYPAKLEDWDHENLQNYFDSWSGDFTIYDQNANEVETIKFNPKIAESKVPVLKLRGRLSSNGRSYSSSSIPFSKARHVDYEPYKENPIPASNKLGGLGANLDTEEYIEKLKKRIKQIEYATSIRNEAIKSNYQNELKNDQITWIKHPDIFRINKLPSEQEKEKNRRMKLYSKTIPKPKLNYQSMSSSLTHSAKSSKQTAPSPKLPIIDDKLEKLCLKHSEYRQQVESIKKSLKL